MCSKTIADTAYCRIPTAPGLVLACPPLVEAAIYTGSGGRDIHDLFAKIDVPVTVLRGEKRDATRSDGFSRFTDVGATR